MRVSPLGANRSVVAPRHLLLLPMLGFAALTFLTQASRVLNGPFRNYALAGGIALVLVVGLWVWLWRAERQAIPAHDGRLLVGLLALGLLGAVLASVYHLPDSDDYMMTPDAVHFISFPHAPLTNQIQFTVPLALFLLISHFAARSKEAMLATLVVVAVVTLLGELKYSPGTLSFTRMFQGKVVLLASGLPFLIALSLAFLGEGSFRRWFYVAACATALCGLSSTAFFTPPMKALALGAAFTVG